MRFTEPLLVQLLIFLVIITVTVIVNVHHTARDIGYLSSDIYENSLPAFLSISG